jgi:hypothetical protein
MFEASSSNDGDDVDSVPSDSQSSATQPVSLTSIMATPVDHDIRTVELTTPRFATSTVWTYFGKYPSHIEGKENVVVCLACRTAGERPSKFEVNYGASKSASKLSSHLEAHHKKDFIEAKKLAKKRSNPHAKEQQFMGLFKADCKVSRKEQIRLAYLKWIISDYVPLGQCNSLAFRFFMKCVDKHYEDEDRKGVRSRLILTADRVRRLLQLMVKGEELAITTDCWTSAANKPYISLTAHFINSNWELNSVVLACELFRGRHVAEQMAGKIHEMLRNFNIDFNNISCCVTDNEPTMNAMADHIAFGWMGCFDHLLELITGVTFEADGIRDVLKRCRQVVGHFSGSSQALASLLKMQQSLDEECNAVSPDADVKTRWWSTYIMLVKMLRLRNAVQALVVAAKVPRYLTDLDWDVMQVLTLILKPFMTVQKFMEGDKYITVSFMPYLVTKIRSTLETIHATYTVEAIEEVNRLPLPTCEQISSCTERMLQLFNQRFGSGEPGTVFTERDTRGERRILKGLAQEAMVASFLDPRTKGSGIPLGIDSDKLKSLVRALMEDEFDTHHRHEEEAVVETVIDDDDEVVDDDDLWGDLVENSAGVANHDRETYSQRRDRVVDDEMFRFAQLPRINLKSKNAIDKDPLLWWKHHEFSMPIMGKLARCYLAIPATSASSERVFSIGGLTVSDNRTRLDADIVSDFVVLKGSWDKAATWADMNNVTAAELDDDDTTRRTTAAADDEEDNAFIVIDD